jgi:hypothetical protein
MPILQPAGRTRNVSKHYMPILPTVNRSENFGRIHYLSRQLQAERLRKSQAHKDNVKKLNSDPAILERNRSAVRAYWADPVNRQKNTARLRAMHADPAFREKQVEHLRRLNAERRAKVKFKNRGEQL